MQKLINNWQSKQWLILAIVFLGLSKTLIVYDYSQLNLITIHLNHIAGTLIYQIPTITDEASTSEHFLDYIPSSSQSNVGALIFQAQGSLAMSKGWKHEAVDLWKNLSPDEQRLFLNSELAYQVGLFESSLQWARWGQEIQPEIGDWAYLQAIVYEQLGQFGLALTYFEHSLEKPLKEVGISDVYYLIGRIWSQENGSVAAENAITHFEKAINLNKFREAPNQTAAHFDLAEVLRKRGQEEEAILNYEWVIGQESDHYSANLRLGSLYWTFEGNMEQARYYLEKAIVLAPERKWAYRNLGMILQETGTLQEAIKLYEQVLIIDPTDSFAKQQLEILGEK